MAIERTSQGRTSVASQTRRRQLLERIEQFNANLAAREQAQAPRADRHPPGRDAGMSADAKQGRRDRRQTREDKNSPQAVARALNDRNASAATTMRAMQAAGPKRGPNLPRGLQNADAFEQLRLIQSRQPIDIRRDPELDNPPISNMRDDLARQHHR